MIIALHRAACQCKPGDLSQIYYTPHRIIHTMAHLRGEALPGNEKAASLEKPAKQLSAGNLNDKEDIASTLVIEKLDTNLYRSLSLSKPHPNARAVFGGQIIGQALVAAHRTLEQKDFHCHSFHSYFLLAGDPTVPAIYHVDRIRDGRSFATRNVIVKQKGRAIFSVMVSFHRPEQSRLTHQKSMPDVPPPEKCVSREEYLNGLVKKAEAEGNEPRLKKFKQALKFIVDGKSPLEIRYVDPEDSSMFPMRPRPAKEPVSRFWFRSKKLLPDNLWAHHCVAAYASDNGMLMVATKPLGHPHTFYSMMASLDHSMWFHSPFRADEWLLYDLHSTRAESGRGITHGSIFTQSGELAMSATQEGVLRLAEQMRPKDPAPKKQAKL